MTQTQTWRIARVRGRRGRAVRVYTHVHGFVRINYYYNTVRAMCARKIYSDANYAEKTRSEHESKH